jgi:hypothetical protein
MAVATAAVVGITATAATTGMSFAQASKQKKLQREAESAAKAMMDDARKKLDVNFYDQLAIQKEPYELEREAMIAAGAQAIEAGVESERGAAATAGRVQMAQNAGQREIASAMGQEMLGLKKLSAAEDSRLRDVNVDLNLEEAAGAQMAAANAQEAANAATLAGVEGIVSMGQQAAAAAPLYAKDRGAQQAAISKLQMTPEQMSQFGSVKNYEGSTLGEAGAGFTNLDFDKIGQMGRGEFKNFLGALSPEQKSALMYNQDYMKMYESFVNPFAAAYNR